MRIITALLHATIFGAFFLFTAHPSLAGDKTMKQADYYMIVTIKGIPPGSENQNVFINNILTSLGWAKGSATAELTLNATNLDLTETAIYSRVRVHSKQTGHEIDWNRTGHEEFYRASRPEETIGVLIYIFYEK